MMQQRSTDQRSTADSIAYVVSHSMSAVLRQSV